MNDMECKAILEVCDNGYLVTLDRRDMLPVKKVYTNIVDALNCVARHTCYEPVVIRVGSSGSASDGQT